MRKIPVILAVGMGLLLFAAVAAELLLGSWFSADALDRLGVPHDVEQAASATALYDGGQDFTYRRDRWGFRGAGVDPAQITVLTVGGDTTNQPDLPDDATWQAVLERDLRADGRAVVIANAGIDGQSSIGHLRAMEEWFRQIPALKPHFVLFSVGVNDAQADGTDVVPRPSTMDLFRRHSPLWQAAIRLAGAASAPPPRQDRRRVDFAAARWTDTAAQPDWRPEGERSVESYKDRLRRLAQASHAMGAVPVFVTQTRADFKMVDGKVQGMVEEGGLNGIDQYRRLATLNRATREVCADEGLLCLDLAREVTFEPGDFYDHLHNTPQGAARIGHWLASKLAGLV